MGQTTRGQEFLDGNKPANYDWQVIFSLQDDSAINNFAAYLYDKHPNYSKLINWFGLRRMEDVKGNTFAIAPTRARIYICGHGTADCGSVAGLTYKQLSHALATQVFPSPGDYSSSLISLVVCMSTRVAHQNSSNNLNHNREKNLAADLHRDLYEFYRIKTRVAGRTECVNVNTYMTESGSEKVRKLVGPEKKYIFHGREVYLLEPGTGRHHVQGDKILYWWDGETQKSGYPSYKDG